MSSGPQKLKLLDLFCGAGGAAVGYARAGFSVVGVDIDPQPSYPFDFIQQDALTLTYEELLTFDVIHASPPCQAYSKASATLRKQGKVYPDLLPPVRHMLAATGLPWVIENVPGAPIRPDIALCGTMFGLKVLRHRYFETNLRNLVSHKMVCNHTGTVLDGDYFTVAGSSGGTLDQWRDAMDVSWMRNRHEVRESIPPAFTYYIGRQILQALSRGTKLRSASHRDRILAPVLSSHRISYQTRLF